MNQPFLDTQVMLTSASLPPPIPIRVVWAGHVRHTPMCWSAIGYVPETCLTLRTENPSSGCGVGSEAAGITVTRVSRDVHIIAWNQSVAVTRTGCGTGRTGQ